MGMAWHGGGREERRRSRPCHGEADQPSPSMSPCRDDCVSSYDVDVSTTIGTGDGAGGVGRASHGGDSGGGGGGGGGGGVGSSSHPSPHHPPPPACSSSISSSTCRYRGNGGGDVPPSHRDGGDGGDGGGGVRERSAEDVEKRRRLLVDSSPARDRCSYDDEDINADGGRVVVRGPAPFANVGTTTTANTSTSTTKTLVENANRNLNGRSVRQRQKMYSDFVGVTYNKTHAKYQACITHNRKQHYLGRYRLAVDAALAYDESARLLKGCSWKVNFRNRMEYEAARAKELERWAKAGGGEGEEDADGNDVPSMKSSRYSNDTYDRSSLAAVASKVRGIASAVARGAFKGPNGESGRRGGGIDGHGIVGKPAMPMTMPAMMLGLLQPFGSEAHRAGYLWHEGPPCVMNSGLDVDRGRGIATAPNAGGGVRWAAQATSGGGSATMSRPSDVATEKVTPSPTLPIAINHGDRKEELIVEGEDVVEDAFPISDDVALGQGVLEGDPTKSSPLDTPYSV
jgi:hypothetical protein